MAKLKSPLFSLDAQNSLGRVISFVKRKVGTVAIKRPQPPDARTLAQLSWRTMYQKCAILWHTLNEAEKANWESLARPLHMTGFAYWQSQCLKPNPGIYLPLAGGTMSGAINMAGFQVGMLPDPAADNDAARKKYVDDQIAALIPHEGARIQNSIDQTIPNLTPTPITFDTVLWDTDTIFDPDYDPTMLVCKTPGKYLIIGQLEWDISEIGDREISIRHNSGTCIAMQRSYTVLEGYPVISVSTIWDLVFEDTLELLAAQTSGDPLDVLYINAYSPEFMMQRIG